jgi:hypothetical protein
MRITIKNTINGKVLSKELIVKVQYDKTKPIVKYEKDQYGREVFTVWQEKITTVSCHEYDPEKTSSYTTYTGTTTCDYHDAKYYSKKLGKQLAWLNCVDELLSNGVINEDEADALDKIELDANVFELDMAQMILKKRK